MGATAYHDRSSLPRLPSLFTLFALSAFTRPAEMEDKKIVRGFVAVQLLLHCTHGFVFIPSRPNDVDARLTMYVLGTKEAGDLSFDGSRMRP